jgi:hypothetical protein
VCSEEERAAIVVTEKAVTPAPSGLTETSPYERSKLPASGKLGEARHRSRCDNDLYGRERLPRRFASLASERVHVELQRAVSPGDRLAACSPVDVAAWNLRYGRDEPSVSLAVDRDDVPKLH